MTTRFKWWLAFFATGMIASLLIPAFIISPEARTEMGDVFDALTWFNLLVSAILATAFSFETTQKRT